LGFKMCSDDSVSTDKSKDFGQKSVTDSVNEKKLQEARIAGLKTQKEDAIKTIKKLTPKFIKKVDEFRDVTFYTHKTFGRYYPNRKTLCAEVNSNGDLNLTSNYYSEDWLFHTKFILLVNGEKAESPTVETFSENNRTDNSGGEIWENVYYGTQNDSSVQNVLILLDTNKGKTAKIRFIGREHYDDATLRQSDVTAILESYYLAKAIKLLKDPEIILLK
ncbi:MAG: hypothetical protein Q7U77_09680, partial [Sediminibacterium sp.]|uniref:hypothetical protein n=1 Tax=Sediminibacterium sp. TaxID=1917865 RepID=UPI0027291879